MKPAQFSYYRAGDVAEALELLAGFDGEAKLLAGGQSLVAMMNFRLARPPALIDITRIGGLNYLRAGPDGLRIGALTPHRAVETTRDPAVLDGFGVLPRSAHWIGHYPIRVRGTFGGSIAHADPASEWCLLAVLLEARIVLRGPDGERTVPADRLLPRPVRDRRRPRGDDHRDLVPAACPPGRADRVRAAPGRLRDRRRRGVRAGHGRYLRRGPYRARRGRHAPAAAGHRRAGRGAGHRGDLAGRGRAGRRRDRPAVGRARQRRLPQEARRHPGHPRPHRGAAGA